MGKKVILTEAQFRNYMRLKLKEEVSQVNTPQQEQSEEVDYYKLICEIGEQIMNELIEKYNFEKRGYHIEDGRDDTYEPYISVYDVANSVPGLSDCQMVAKKYKCPLYTNRSWNSVTFELCAIDFSK